MRQEVKSIRKRPGVALFAMIFGPLFLLTVLAWTLRPSPQAPRPAAAPSAASLAPPAPAFIAWLSSLEVALQSSRSSGKPVMIDFYTDGCEDCRWMDSNTYTAPDVINLTQDFVPLKVNAEYHPEIAQRYHVTRFPTVIWTDGEGNERRREERSLDASAMVIAMQAAR